MFSRGLIFLGLLVVFSTVRSFPTPSAEHDNKTVTSEKDNKTVTSEKDEHKEESVKEESEVDQDKTAGENAQFDIKAYEEFVRNWNEYVTAQYQYMQAMEANQNQTETEKSDVKEVKKASFMFKIPNESNKESGVKYKEEYQTVTSTFENAPQKSLKASNGDDSFVSKDERLASQLAVNPLYYQTLFMASESNGDSSKMDNPYGYFHYFPNAVMDGAMKHGNETNNSNVLVIDLDVGKGEHSHGDKAEREETIKKSEKKATEDLNAAIEELLEENKTGDNVVKGKLSGEEGSGQLPERKGHGH